MTVDMICKIAPYGYWVLVKKFFSGHRAGYVGVPETHPLAGRDRDWPVVREMVTPMGHVTYADRRVGGWEGHPIGEKVRWFGVDNMDEKIPEDTLNDALNSCLALARQLSDYSDRHQNMKPIGFTDVSKEELEKTAGGRNAQIYGKAVKWDD